MYIETWPSEAGCSGGLLAATNWASDDTLAGPPQRAPADTQLVLKKTPRRNAALVACRPGEDETL